MKVQMKVHTLHMEAVITVGILNVLIKEELSVIENKVVDIKIKHLNREVVPLNRLTNNV